MLDRHILTFNENIIGLRDFISLIGPFIEEHHDRAIKEQKQIINTFDIAKKISDETDEETIISLKEEIKAIYDGQLIEAVHIEKSEIKDDKDEDKDRPEFFIAVPASLNPRIEQAMRAPRKTSYQKELLYKNAFIGLLSSVEYGTPQC